MCLPGEESWTCPQCTYTNDTMTFPSICEICGGARPISKAAELPAAPPPPPVLRVPRIPLTLQQMLNNVPAMDPAEFWNGTKSECEIISQVDWVTAAFIIKYAKHDNDLARDIKSSGILNRMIEKLLDLRAMSSKPWEDHVEDWAALDIKQPMLDLFYCAIKDAVFILTRDDGMSLEILERVLDPLCPLYHSYIQSLNGGHKGNKLLHENAVLYFREIEGLPLLNLRLVKLDVRQMTTVARLVSKNSFRPDERLAFVNACLDQLHIRDLISMVDSARVFYTLVDHLLSISHPNSCASLYELDDVSKLCVKLALRFMSSPKLRFRRFGLEAFGKMSAKLNSIGYSREIVTGYFKSLGVYSEIFGERLDERVVDCSEELLRQSFLDADILLLLVCNTESRAARNLMGAIFTFETVSDANVVFLLEELISRILTSDDWGAMQVFYSALDIIHNGAARASCLRGLWRLLFEGKGGCSLIRHFGTCIQCADEVIRLEYMESCLAVITGSFEQLDDESSSAQIDGNFFGNFEDDFDEESDEYLSPMKSSEEDVLMAYKLLKGMSLTDSDTKLLFVDEVCTFISRSPIRLESDLADDEKSSARLVEHLEARLDTLHDFVQRGNIELSASDMERLWSCCCSGDAINSGSSMIEEVFLKWLRDLDAPLELQEHILINLMTAVHLDLSHLQPKGYHCFQTLFVSVNQFRGHLEATELEACRSEFEFSFKSPPVELDGSKLIGRRVEVLFDDETMMKGEVTKYTSWSNTHTIKYQDGRIEEKVFSSWKLWRLLPTEGNLVAGPVEVKAVHALEELVGLQSLWSVALTACDEVVSAHALDVLISIYAGSGYHQEFVDHIFELIEQADKIDRCLRFLDLFLKNTAGDFCHGLGAIGRGRSCVAIVNDKLTITGLHTRVELITLMKEIGRDITCLDIRDELNPDSYLHIEISEIKDLLLEDLGFTGVCPLHISVEKDIGIGERQITLDKVLDSPSYVLGLGGSVAMVEISNDKSRSDVLLRILGSLSSYSSQQLMDTIMRLPVFKSRVHTLLRKDWDVFFNSSRSIWDPFYYSLLIDAFNLMDDLTKGPETFLVFFRDLLKHSIGNRLSLNVIYPYLTGLALTKSNSLLLPTSSLLLVLISLHDELEYRVDVEQETLYLGVQDDSFNLSTAERSKLPPVLPRNISRWKPLVSRDSVQTRRMVRAAVDTVTLLERNFLLSTQRSGVPEASGEMFDKLVRKFLLACSLEHVRVKVRNVLEKLWRDSQFSSLIRTTMLAAARDLEPAQFSVTCKDFFKLFSCMIPLQKDTAFEEMAIRITFLILEWPNKERPIALEYKVQELELFAGFVNFLSEILEQNPHVLNVVSQLDATKYGDKQLINILWSKFLMDATSETPFCNSQAARSCISRLLVALTAHGPAKQQEMMSLIDRFSNITAMPLKEGSKGWSFVPDWNFQPYPQGDLGSIFKGRNATGHVGLKNRGSTCYMNALVQLLFHIEPYRNAILLAPVSPPKEELNGEEREHKVVGWVCICSGINDTNGTSCHICYSPKTVQSEMITGVSNVYDAGGSKNMEVLRQLQRTFRFLLDSRKGCYDPIPFVESCAALKLEFPVTSQNDASEFYDKLLDNLEISLKRTPQLSIMNECFQGTQIKLKRCHSCGVVTTSREESFFRLELMTKDNSVQKNSLEECLSAFVAPEILTGDNKVDCAHCNARTSCTFMSCVSKLPRFLFVHPKRFSFDLQSMQTVKLNHRISFPSDLNMFPFTRTGLAVQVDKQQDETEFHNAQFDYDSLVGPMKPTEEDVNREEEDSQYLLSGVLVHRGRAGGGHYYSFQRVGEQWFKFDDAKVSAFEAAIGTLSDECFGGTFESSNDWGKPESVEKEGNAFMLLYERQSVESGENYEEESVLTKRELAQKQKKSIRREKYSSIESRPLVKSVSSRVAVLSSRAQGSYCGSVKKYASFNKRLSYGYSLAEHTLRGLINSHNDWQSRRFNALLNEEVRISNVSYSRQALLFDPFISIIAQHQLIPANFTNRGFCHSAIRVFTNAILRSPVDPICVSEWLGHIACMFEIHPSLAVSVVSELVSGKASYADPNEEMVLMREVENVQATLFRLQQHSRALDQVGPPLLSCRGFHHQILTCSGSLLIYMKLVRMAVDVDDSLHEDLIKMLLDHCKECCEHRDTIEMFSVAWAKLLVDSENHKFLSACNRLNVLAVLVHVYLGADSPGHKLHAELLHRAFTPAGFMAKPSTYLISAIQVLCRQPILTVASTDLLSSSQFFNKVMEEHLSNPALMQDFLVELIGFGIIDTTQTAVFCLKSLRKTTGAFNPCMDAATNDNRALKTDAIVALMLRLDRHSMFDRVTAAAFDELSKTLDPVALKEDPGLLYEEAKNEALSLGPFGNPHYMFAAIAAVLPLGYQPPPFIMMWIKALNTRAMLQPFASRLEELVNKETVLI